MNKKKEEIGIKLCKKIFLIECLFYYSLDLNVMKLKE